MRIAFYEIEGYEKPILKKAFPNDKLTFNNSPVKTPKDAEVLSIFIYSKVNKRIMDAMPSLKHICTRSTGFDHIDIEYAKKKGIKVSNVPTYGENTVAEHTFGLLLSITREIPQALKSKKSSQDIRGTDLKGKKIGIVGMGNIGKHMARIAKGFEMDVIAYDIYKDNKLAKEIGFRYAPLDTILNKSDVISLHCPCNKYTHHIINKRNINAIKKGAILLNTARGGLIETKALISALKNKRIHAAALDVTEQKMPVMKNLFITPHNAYNTHEALNRILNTTIKNIKRKINVI